MFDRWFSRVFFALLVVWAACSFLERICYMDSGYYLFNMLEQEGFYFAHNRYGTLFTQIIPVLLILIKAPLMLVMIGYSVNFILVGAASFYLCMFRWHNRKVAYAMALLMVFSVGLTFYWPVSEMFLSLIYAMAFYGWWSSPRYTAAWKRVLVGILLIALAIHTYLPVVICLGFLLVYDFLDQKSWRNWDKMRMWGLACLSVSVIWKMKAVSAYEEMRSEALGRIPDILPNLLDTKGAKMLIEHHTGAYCMLLGGLLAVSVLLMTHGKIVKLLVLYVFYSIYFVVVVAIYPDGEISLIMENMMLPFAFFLSFLICKEAFELYRMARIAIFVWMALSFIRIVNERRQFVDRGKYYEALSENLTHTTGRKLVFSGRNFAQGIDAMYGEWAVFSESLLYSAIKNKEECFMVSVSYDYSFGNLMYLEHPENYVLNCPWDEPQPYSEFPVDYFPIPAQPFSFVNTRSFLSEDSVCSLLSASEIIWVEPLASLSVGDSVDTKIRVEYHGNDFLFSGLSVSYPLYLTHRFFHQGKEVDWERPRVPLMMDVRSGMTQLLAIKMPDQECDVEIEFSLHASGIDTVVRTRRMPIRVRK